MSRACLYWPATQRHRTLRATRFPSNSARPLEYKELDHNQKKSHPNVYPQPKIELSMCDRELDI